MILVDTSTWVELARRRPAGILPEMVHNFATCGPILQELLQGMRPGAVNSVLRHAVVRLPRLSDPLPSEIFLAAAEIFSQGRAKGYTIRSSVDCLIAAVAIENRVAVLHNDRDFDAIAQFTPLRALRLEHLSY